MRLRAALLALALAPLAFGAWFLAGGELEERGTPAATPTPPEILAARDAADRAVGSQILFGDLHVHTTYSTDAFMRSLPLLGGEGAKPPADACDFARYCANLDFFAITDHAEALTLRRWQEIKQAVRECNAVGGERPDLVAFTGFEWTQVGLTPETHYGHKNVIYPGTADHELPARPISAPGIARVFRDVSSLGVPVTALASVPFRDWERRQRYRDLARYGLETRAMDECPPGDPRSLPADCRESAETPAELFAKLDAWGLDALVIPHGTTWGMYTPPGYRFDKQLLPEQRDPERERLIEVYSGHGNSEEYRAWEHAADGECPAPTPGFEPCCHRAGELVRARCAEPGASCEAEIAHARRAYVAAGVAGHSSLPWASVADWGRCGQCLDCFQPAFNYRPGGAVQYAVAKGDFSDPKAPYHARFGFIASSDTHSARPGTGYKEVARHQFTDTQGPESESWTRLLFPRPPPNPHARELSLEDIAALPPLFRYDLERQSSFFLSGGLVAVHAASRERSAIWDALVRREVYGTSGPRILLWFHARIGEARHPMGSILPPAPEVHFTVRAAGAFVQRPGCPEWSMSALGPERVAALCAGECNHPSDRRHDLDRVEVIRIRRQTRPDQPIAELIEDPWRKLPCGGPTCEVELVAEAEAGTLYYVRAIQRASPTMNADPMRGEPPNPCYGDHRTPREDDCLGPSEARAWSSPIYFEAAP